MNFISPTPQIAIPALRQPDHFDPLRDGRRQTMRDAMLMNRRAKACQARGDESGREWMVRWFMVYARGHRHYSRLLWARGLN